MRMFVIVATLFFLSYTPALASKWIRVAKDSDTYYDAESYLCFKTFDRSSGRATGYTATVWVKTISGNFIGKEYIWSFACGARKVDRLGGDYPSITGDNIRPDSTEEKLYKEICPICDKYTYSK